MSDAKDYVVRPDEKGTVNISEEVVAAIAALAVSEVEGVYGLSSSFTADIKEMLGKKNMSKGVKLTIEEDVVTVECYVIATYGYEIPVVAANVQESVIGAVESMTGLKVAAVHVDIVGISQPKAYRIGYSSPLSRWQRGFPAVRSPARRRITARKQGRL